MAISVADIFRPGPMDGTQQILASAQNVLQLAIGSAIQIGRDTANLRASQEREFLAERERAVQLDQRRAEGITQQANTDRAFKESVARDRRDFAFTANKDARDFNYDREMDAKKFALDSLRVGSSIGLQAEGLDLQKEEAKTRKAELDAEKAKREAEDAKTKAFLNERADSIVAATKPRGIIERVFGFGNDQSPRSLVDMGSELLGVAKILGDPELAAKADSIKMRGQEALAKVTPKAAAAVKKGKTEATTEEKIAKLETQIKAWTITEDELGKLPPAEAMKKNMAVLELEALRKKATEQPGQPPVVNPVDTAKSYLERAKR